MWRLGLGVCITLLVLPWWVTATCVIAILWFSWPDVTYFTKRGIPCLTAYPIIGTVQSGPDMDKELVVKHGEQQCVGGFIGRTPMLFVLDADMLSEIYVGQSAAFTNRMSGSHIPDEMLLDLKDVPWEHVRHGMTPTLTSMKLKQMNSEMNKCSQGLAESLVEQAVQGGEVEITQLIAGYSRSVRDGTVPSIEVTSQMGGLNERVLPRAHPALLLSLPVLQPRLFQLMMHAQRGKNNRRDAEGEQEQEQGNDISTAEDISAHAQLYLTGGHNSTGRSLSFFLYNMARYPDVQAKLVDEIKAVVADKKEIDTDIVNNMPYLDQCVDETLRMYPPLTEMTRIAQQDVTVQGVYIEKGTVISLPIHAIHHHPSKWPEPYEFNPERFSPENKKNRNPYHFVPFGHGARSCLGMCLAVQELKVAIIHVLRKVKVTTSEKTEIPITFAASATVLSPMDGIFLNVKPKGLIHKFKKKSVGGKKLVGKVFSQVKTATKEFLEEESDYYSMVSDARTVAKYGNLKVGKNSQRPSHSK